MLDDALWEPSCLQDTPASAQQMMQIFQRQKSLDHTLGVFGCSNVCVAGAAGSLPTFGNAQADRTRQNALARQLIRQ